MKRLLDAQVTASLVLGAALLVPVTSAVANGRPPASISIHRELPTNTAGVRGGGGGEETLAFGVTFGLLLSFDSGGTWQWICEQAIGFGGIFDPDYEVLADGSLFAATLSGLRHTTDGCTWTTVELGAPFASSIAVAGNTVLAAAADFTDSRIYRSTNSGDAFAVLSTPCTTHVNPANCGTGDWWKSIEIAKADTDRVYLSGFVFIPNPACESGCDCANGACPVTIKQQTLFRSDNGGAAWTELPTTGLALTPQSDIIVAAISPTNPDELYLRVTQTVINESSDIIYKSTNAGASFTTFLDLSAADVRREARATLVRANGDVWIGTKEGLYIGTGGVPPTDMTSTYHAVCLEENGDGKVIGCSDNFGPEMAALATTTDGVTWTKVMRFNEIAGPFQCAEGTDQKEICADLQWCGLASQFGIPAVGCSGDAGTDGPLVDPPEPKKCGCQANDTSALASLGLLGLLAAGWLWRRRGPLPPWAR